MYLTKSYIKVLKYLYHRPSGVSYGKLNKKYGVTRITNLIKTGYIAHNYKFPLDADGFPVGTISDYALCFVTDAGKVEVERHQWFDAQFVIAQLIIPIIVGVSSAIITALILSA
jgi:hypothetical protein